MNIEIDITYRCNMACPNCDRFCNMDEMLGIKRGDGDMSVGQIQKFINQAIDGQAFFNRVRIAGGEPVLHPEFETIVDMVLENLVYPGLINEMEILTNGIVKPKEKYAKYSKCFDPLPKRRHICIFYEPNELHPGPCNIYNHCGISLNKYGYMLGGHCASLALLLGYAGCFMYQMPLIPENDFAWAFGALCPRCPYNYTGSIFCLDKRAGRCEFEVAVGRPISDFYKDRIKNNHEFGFVEPPFF